MYINTMQDFSEIKYPSFDLILYAKYALQRYTLTRCKDGTIVPLLCKKENKQHKVALRIMWGEDPKQ